MAFMMPVMKNNYDIYKDTSRSRKTSDCSNASSNGVTPAILGASNGRTRKVSECKSESFATSPSHQNYPAYRMQIPRTQSHRGFTRNGSRTSPNSAGAFSPSRSFCQQASTSPPKNAYNATTIQNTGSQNDITKFHQRLVDKLRKSFRKESSKRS